MPSWSGTAAPATALSTPTILPALMSVGAGLPHPGSGGSTALCISRGLFIGDAETGGIIADELPMVYDGFATTIGSGQSQIHCDGELPPGRPIPGGSFPFLFSLFPGRPGDCLGGGPGFGTIPDLG